MPSEYVSYFLFLFLFLFLDGFFARHDIQWNLQRTPFSRGLPFQGPFPPPPAIQPTSLTTSMMPASPSTTITQRSSPST
ncbi:hypothetical protein HOY82DRAFT_563075 [Tuber indicum]|nr:hypothetical protein HOY82DRAFT_563075 [Tuber indicum]